MKTIKGFHCPKCKGHRLFVADTVRILSQVIRRYRRCSACGYSIVTEERIAKRNKS